jgi:hypothetical protein
MKSGVSQWSSEKEMYLTRRRRERGEERRNRTPRVSASPREIN